MADPIPSTEANSDADVGPGRPSAPRTPLWVKVFGVIILAVVVMLGVMLIVGGGPPSGHGPGRHRPSGNAGGHALPAGGDANTSGIGRPAGLSEAARTVAVTTLDTMAFAPSSITVRAGETVTFVVTNSGQATHDFTLGDAAMQQDHASAMARRDGRMAHDQPNSITLPPGQTKQLTWRFGDRGTIEYACHEPGHYQAGMRGQITIA